MTIEIQGTELRILAESEDDSRILAALGQPGTTLTGEVGFTTEHFLALRPKRQVLSGGAIKEF